MPNLGQPLTVGELAIERAGAGATERPRGNHPNRNGAYQAVQFISGEARREGVLLEYRDSLKLWAWRNHVPSVNLSSAAHAHAARA